MNATVEGAAARPERGRIRGADARARRRRSARRGSPNRPSTWNAGFGRSSRSATAPIAANLVIGEVLLIHIDDAVLDPSGRVDPRKLRTIARLGGNYYCRSTDLFEMERP